MGNGTSRGHDARWFMAASIAAMGIAANHGCATSAPATTPTAPYLIPIDRAPGAAWTHTRTTARAAVMPRQTHSLAIVREVIDADGRLAIAVSADGHVSLRDLGSGETRASFSLNEVDLETAVIHISEDSRRALVGTLAADGTVNRMFLWDLVADHRITLIDAVREWEERPRRFAAIHADPALSSIFVAELEPADEPDDGNGGTRELIERMRIRVFDGGGVARCTSEPVARRDEANAIAAIDGTALFLARVGESSAERVDARNCSLYPMPSVASVLATRPNGGQMVTLDLDGQHSLRRPVDGRRLAPIPAAQRGERYFYDPHGVCLAMVDASNRVLVVRHDDFVPIAAARQVDGEVLGVEPACGAVVLERANATVRLELLTGAELRFAHTEPTRGPRMVGGSESRVRTAVYVPSRASVLVIAAAGVVEWTGSGARVTACRGDTRPVFDAEGAVRLVSASGYCDVARDRWVARPVHATSDDGVLALVGREAGSEESAPAYLVDLRDDAIRGTLAELGPTSEGTSVTGHFTADGSMLMVQTGGGAPHFYATGVVGLRGRYPVPEGHRLEALGRTPDGSGFVLGSIDTVTEEESLLRIDPRRPTEAVPYDGSPAGSPASQARTRLTPLECRDGALTITTEEPQAIGECGLLATDGANATGIVTNAGRLAIVVDEETTHLIGLGDGEHIELRASFGAAPDVRVMPFAIDSVGRAYVELAHAHDALVRHAGDARTARLTEPSARDRLHMLRGMIRLLERAPER